MTRTDEPHQPDPPTTPAQQPKPFGWRFSLPLLLGSTLNPINSSMIAVGLVSIAADFRTGPAATASLVSVLYLCSAVMQPTMGKLSTLFGPRRVFLSGVAVLLIGGAVGGLAPDLGVLLASRALIGVGTSACYPTAMALVRRRARLTGAGVPSRVLGSFSIAAQITVVIGLPLGGVLAGAFGWRALFWVNVPLAALVIAFAAVAVERDEQLPRRGAAATVAALDLPGITLFAGTVVALLVFLGALSRPRWWLLVVAVALGVLLVVRERRTAAPLLDVVLLVRDRPLQRTYGRQLLAGLGMYTALYGASQWLEASGGYSPAQVGLIMLPLSLASIGAARLVSTRGWVRTPLMVGAAMLIASGAVMLVLHGRSPLPGLVGMSVLFGLATGFSNVSNQTALYVQTADADIATASGLLRTFAYVGAIFSSSLIGLTFGPRVSDHGFHLLGWAVIGIGVASLLLTGLDQAIPARVLARRDAA